MQDVLQGDFYDRFQVAEGNRVIRDIAISGNGEPTSLKNFARAVDLIGTTIAKANIPEQHKLVLITNGSLIHHENVRQGLETLHLFAGEVWFKVDSATQSGQKFINNAASTGRRMIDNLIISADLCPTWLQTCLFSINGNGVPESEHQAYLQLLEEVQKRVELRGVLLYTLARPSLQPEAGQLTKLSEASLNSFAKDIRKKGLKVKVSC